ncbi:MAG: hypothetical protein HZA90_08440 [Verrucomicrobia bacterium]|nr:hypothetical protein [Verrucomicrobiota bacterium]
MTLAEKIGAPAKPSLLLEKAARLGLGNAGMLEALAVARGCWHYQHPEMAEPPKLSEAQFTNEELAIALLSPSLPYSPHTIRVGAAMLGAEGNGAESLAELAASEGCEMVVRYIAEAASEFEPEHRFWTELLRRLHDTSEPAEGILPHPTRFVSMTGITRAGRGRVTNWIRPRPELAAAHG